MYTNVSSAFTTKLAKPSRHFAARFKYNNTVLDFDIKSITMTIGTCGGSSFAVGCAFAGYIEVTMKYTDTLLEGKELALELGLLLDNGNYEYVPFGYWTVQKPTKNNDMMTFQAVDRMASKLSGDYETSLTYPATIANVISELATKTGLTINCSLQTSNTLAVKIDGVTNRGALAIIAATLLGNAWVDRNGNVQITKTTTTNPVGLNYDYVKTQPQMDEEATVIGGVKVYTVSGSRDTWIERGSGTTVEVSDVYMTSTILDSVRNNVMGLTYNGGEVSFMGNPLLDPSDAVRFNNAYTVPCMEIVHVFDGGLLTTVTAPGKFEATDSTIQVGAITEELSRRAQETAEAQATADEALSVATDVSRDFADAVLQINGDISDLQNQIDGNITTWFYAVDPTTSNPPASSWTTTDEKNNHLGDLYYNTESGHAWRWMKTNNVFSWGRISDSDIAEALAVAQAAQDTADGKRRVFYTTPTTPYDKGDLWVQGSSGDIKYCNTARSSGSYNSSDWVIASKYTDNTAANAAQSTADAALALAQDVSSDFADAVLRINGDLEDLQEQIDGNITTWFYAVDPTTSNQPASSWTTTAEKDNHLGDLYYNTTSGYVWRWMKTNNVYSWGRITDSDVTEALALAHTAQDTADGKRRVFYTTPTPPYDKGDLWVQGSTGDIKYCNTARSSGSYNSSDWVLASKYTDDTAANAAQATADSAVQTANNAVTMANGKNKTFFQNSAPSSGMVAGDLWFDTDGGNAIYEYKVTSNVGTWTLRQLGQGSIVAGSITGNEIYGNTLSGIFANIGEITAGVLRSSDYSYTSGNTYTTAGMIIDLNNKIIRTPKTAILSDGTIHANNGVFTGEVNSTYGTIGGFTISATSLSATGVSINSYESGGAYIVMSDTNAYLNITPYHIGYYSEQVSSTSALADVGCTNGLWGIVSVAEISSTNGNELNYIILGRGAIDVVDLGTSNADVRVQNSLGALTMRADSNGDYGFIGTVGSSTEWLLYYDKADARAEIPHTLKITGDADISGTTTVSGLLKTSENIHLRTDVQKGTIPSAQAYRQIIWYDRGTGTDTATNRLGNITCSINTSGANQMYISVYEPSAASTSNHFLSILYPRSGNATLRWSGEEAYFGGTTDSTAHGVYVSNSVASLALYTSANGNHGLYSATNSAMMLYHESGSTDIVIPHTTRITSGSLGINKTSGTDGNAGFWANASGNLYLTGGTGAGGYIYFFYNKATSSTSYIRESASGELTVNAYLVAKDYSGNSRRVVTSYATDGQRVATFGAVGAQTLYISGQWSTTGTTYTSKTITVSSSDIRLKEHIKPSTVDALNMIEQIKIREFDWKDGRADKHQKIGMVADEIEKLDPLLSVGGGTDENGGIVYKSVDTFYLVGYLVKAVQELSAKVKALEKGA